jgi:hypothetical protein
MPIADYAPTSGDFSMAADTLAGADQVSAVVVMRAVDAATVVRSSAISVNVGGWSPNAT